MKTIAFLKINYCFADQLNINLKSNLSNWFGKVEEM